MRLGGRLEQIELFAAIANAYINGNAKNYNDVAKYISEKKPHLVEEWLKGEKRDEAVRDAHFTRCAQHIAKAMEFKKKLIETDNKGTWLTPTGKTAGEWCNRIFACIDRHSPPLEPAAQIQFTLATPHFYEWTALPSILGSFTQTPIGQNVDFTVRQTQDVVEGINLLRDREVDALLDGVHPDIRYPGTERIKLPFTLSPIVLMPAGDGRPKRQKVESLTLDQLREAPLAYVEMPDNVRDLLMRISPRGRRIRVSTTATVINLVKESGYYGLAVNWKRPLGDAFGRTVRVGIVTEIIREVELALFIRKEKLKNAAFGNVLDTFETSAHTFFAGEAKRKALIPLSRQ